MALIVKDRVQETTSTTGTGTLTLSGAVSGFNTFSSAIGNTNTTYYAIVGGTEWEVGIGTVGAGTLSRDTVLDSSTGSAVTFSAGVKNVFCTYPAGKAVTLDDVQTLVNKTLTSPTLTAPVLGTPASGNLANCTFPTLNQNTTGSSGSCTGNAATATLAVTATNYSGIPSGTVMLFIQTTAPTGWTKSVTHDNKALRIVSGTASSGGSVAFTTAFASQSVTGSVAATASATATNQATTATGTVSVTVGAGTLAVGAGTFAVGATTLTESQIPAHTHQQGRASENLTLAYGRGPGTGRSDSLNTQTQNLPYVQTIGGGGSHVHGLTGSPSLSGSPSITGQSFTANAHNHTQDAHSHTSGAFSGNAINLAVQYVDAIIATKN